jgi:chromosomal replication initiator protein
MKVWAQVLAAVGKRVPQQCIETWFEPLVYAGCDGSSIQLAVPTENFRKWFLDNYAELLQDAVTEVLHAPVRVNVTVQKSTPEIARKASEPASSLPTPCTPNEKYTFGSFVVGSSNQFARAAAFAVAERPSKAYNPLYIYGGAGLGKTHLMHAVCNFIHQRNPRLRLTYLSSEHFMNELINSIRYDRTAEFRDRYRNIDVLLMDDIQFIAGKERTQEEFFHTFNALYDAQKQIVITSDCPPKQIATMEERLHSRFEWGLIADIQPPDLETKVAILRKKAEAEGLGALSDEVALFIAGGIQSNIRELEGALTRLAARASLEGIGPAAIDIDYARDVLKNLVRDARAISVEKVIQAVSTYYGLKPAQLKAKSNARPIAQPRQVAMYITKQVTNLSLPQIGKDFGGKHHTTVLHSIRKIDSLKKDNDEISTAVSSIMKTIR